MLIAWARSYQHRLELRFPWHHRTIAAMLDSGQFIIDDEPERQLMRVQFEAKREFVDHLADHIDELGRRCEALRNKVARNAKTLNPKQAFELATIEKDA